MSQLKIPAELKKISPFIRRAEELDKDKSSAESRLVAYYCRQYAVRIGIPLAGASAAAKTCLGELLGALEGEKPAMDNFTLKEAEYLCKAFAERIFDKADQEDLNGAATKDTAKTFYAAGSFLQILEQFSNEEDEDAAEIKKKILYCKWKATDILKAIKEGREPTPGGYNGQSVGEDPPENQELPPNNVRGGDPAVGGTVVDPPDALPGVNPALARPNQPAVETVTNEDEVEYAPPTLPSPPPSQPMMPLPSAPKLEEEGTEIQLGPPPAYPNNNALAPKPFVVLPPPEEDFSPPPAPSISQPPPPSLPQPPMMPPAPSMPPAPPPASSTGGFLGFGRKKTDKASKAQIADATELTKFALAALEDKDANLAVSRLKQALQALGH